MRTLLISCVLGMTGLVFAAAILSLPTSGDADAQIATLKAAHAQETAALSGQIADLQQQATGYTTRIAELESGTSDAQVADLQRAIAEKTAALDAAQAEIAELSRQTAGQSRGPAELLARISDFETQISRLTSQTAELIDAVAERDSIITELRASLDASSGSAAKQCQQRSDALFANAQITFAPGTAALAESALPLLEELATIAAACASQDLLLSIEGHTGTANGETTNLLLSNGRARAVHDFLMSRGVAKTAMRAVGFGASDPVADSTSEAGLAQNERIVFEWQEI